MKKFKFTISGNQYEVEILGFEENVAKVEVNGTVYDVEVHKDLKVTKTPTLVRAEGPQPKGKETRIPKNVTRTTNLAIKAPLPGTIIQVLVSAGEKVVMGQKLLTMEDRLRQRVVGQPEAIIAVSNAIRRARAGLQDENRPLGSFLFLGPTGVGKTEVARSLAAFLFGSERSLIRFDMSEYMEKHSVSKLIGSPPGYVGHEEGGQLTERVKRNPYSVVLLDEIEKAHPDVFNILLQVMDHGTLTDNNGKKADFRNVILMMTSNAGTREMVTQTIGFGEVGKDTASKGRKAIEQMFSPEFRNRLDDTINFNPLSPAIMEMVVDKFMKELNGQLVTKKVKLSYSPAVRTWLAKKGHDPRYGARPLARVIQTEVKNKLSDEILFGRLAKGGELVLDLAEDKIAFEVAAS